MFFLGNIIDGVVFDDKVGEFIFFYIFIFCFVNFIVGFNFFICRGGFDDY